MISGFLITSIIASDLARGQFSFADFYERRARRILPALVLVVLCCLPAAWWLLTPGDMTDFAKSLMGVALFASNVVFWLQSGYFDSAAEMKPLLHTESRHRGAVLHLLSDPARGDMEVAKELGGRRAAGGSVRQPVDCAVGCDPQACGRILSSPHAGPGALGRGAAGSLRCPAKKAAAQSAQRSTVGCRGRSPRVRSLLLRQDHAISGLACDGASARHRRAHRMREPGHGRGAGARLPLDGRHGAGQLQRVPVAPTFVRLRPARHARRARTGRCPGAGNPLVRSGVPHMAIRRTALSQEELHLPPLRRHPGRRFVRPVWRCRLRRPEERRLRRTHSEPPPVRRAVQQTRSVEPMRQ
ncbi:acyltransferase [Ramlibacter terrae]|uniref:Acyltransferase n=1 Tax=Ramlibacter terrae TaxID=2732511 RepID=A0ABX6P2Y4_9BURK|nr:acyltransferase [Ramlibacter terrae]